jgi:ribonucleotide monophosphatase NagD (HAD superfamily)
LILDQSIHFLIVYLRYQIFGENCYHIGPERDLNIFEGTNVNRVDFNNSDFIFVTGLFNDEIEDENDYLDLLNSAREREMTLVCANPDLLVQRGDKLIPCAGLISKTYEEMGGKKGIYPNFFINEFSW